MIIRVLYLDLGKQNFRSRVANCMDNLFSKCACVHLHVSLLMCPKSVIVVHMEG